MSHELPYTCAGCSVAQISSLVVEVFLTGVSGVLMGLTNAMSPRLYSGVLRVPYSLISPAPDDMSLPLLCFFVNMAIGVAMSPAAVRVFGADIAVRAWMYGRRPQASAACCSPLHHAAVDRAAGVLARDRQRPLAAGCVRRQDGCGTPSHHVGGCALRRGALHASEAAWLVPCVRVCELDDRLVCLRPGRHRVCAHRPHEFVPDCGDCCDGACPWVMTRVQSIRVVLMFVSPLPQAISSACGFSPTLADVRTWGVWPVWASFPAAHAAECLYGVELLQWQHLFDVQQSSHQIGYALHAYGGNIAAMAVIGVAWRVINYLLLVLVRRNKQR